jgi:gas vesicle protein GvpA/GvpJ/GvpM family
MERFPTVSGNANLVDILDRILDKGLVIAGDIRVSLANVELLTVRIRLLICSVDKAEQIGMNWWKFDPNLTHRMPGGGENRALPAARSAQTRSTASSPKKQTRRSATASSTRPAPRSTKK